MNRTTAINGENRTWTKGKEVEGPNRVPEVNFQKKAVDSILRTAEVEAILMVI